MNDVNTNQRRSIRRGGVYVAVLGVAMIVTVIGLASMQIARIETRAAVTSNEIACAQMAAQSALEFALGNIAFNGPGWRTVYTHGEEVPQSSWFNLGNCAKFKFMLLDADANLADDPSDRVTIRAIGRAGGATSVTTATYAPTGTGLTCLEASLHSGGNLSISGATVDGTGILSSNAGIQSTGGANINIAVECVGFATGGGYNSSWTEGITPRTMPDASTVFDYYIANGTPIDINDLSSPNNAIRQVVLSPGNNPYGAGTTNPLGIYVIDCQGQTITIENSRLEATLVILNPGASSVVDKDIHWEAAVANYPALTVDGNFKLTWDGTVNLDEEDLGRNFNPPGSPYQGIEDSDQDDTYPGVIKGLIYVSGNLDISNYCKLDGAVVVGGNCTVTAALDLTYRDTFLNDPPPGFSGGTQMELVPGSWDRDAY